MKLALLLLAGCLTVVITGCIAFPAPAFGNKVESGERIQSADVAFVRLGATTREEFESKLGAPWTNYTDLRVSVYCWEMVTGYWVWGWAVPFGGPSDGGVEHWTRTEILFVAFDEKDCVERLKMLRHPKNMSTKEAALVWRKSDK